MIRIIFLAFAIFISTPSIAISQEVVTAESVANEPVKDLELEMVEKTEPEVTGDWIAMIMAWILGIQIILRGIAEGLTRIAVYTETNIDNKVASWLSEITWIIGVAIGKFGYSVPKLVVEEKAKQVNERKKGN